MFYINVNHLTIMPKMKCGLLSDKFAIASVAFSVLVVLFTVFAVMDINLWATYITLILIMLVGIFGIMPHAFEEMK